MKNILFYKYVEIENPEKLRDEQIKLAKSLNLLGTVLIAKEGINGCVSGNDSEIDKYKKTLTSDKRFSDLKFKEADVLNHTFRKLYVRARNEIVSLKNPADLDKKGNYIEARELKHLLDNKRDIILLDARNNYEHEIGRFKGAVHLDIDTFREFPSKIKQLSNIINSIKNKGITNNPKDNNYEGYIKNNKTNTTIKNQKNDEDFKNKKIITYCTGGVRCEKASALLKEAGFENVYQLHDGIVNYGKECGDSYWEGKCFVFDTRGAIDIDPKKKSEPITQCALCHLPSGELHQCSYVKCDRFFTACDNCLEVLEGCCSKRCRNNNSRIKIILEN